MSFITDLTAAYQQHASSENAIAMTKYMKDNFAFYGLKTDVRRALQKTAIEANKPEVKQNARAIALELYKKPKREHHYAAIEILMQELKKAFVKDDIKLIKYMLVTHSWWDSVDTIYLLGGYLDQFPQERGKVVEQFSSADNMWLNRSAILFQLGYKKSTDEKLLFRECEKHRESKEFYTKGHRMGTARICQNQP